ncbi:MAG: hypothetical protein R6V56_04460 [Lentisphaeria bacterium]
MKTRQASLNNQRGRLLVLIAVLFLCTAAGRGQTEGSGITMSSFRTRKTDAEGNTQWQLEGKRARIGEVLVSMKDVELILFRPGKTDLLIQSPAADYNRAMGIISGSGEVHAETEGFTVDGRGYRMLAGQRKLNIENDVRMVIEHAGASMDKLLPGSHPAEDEDNADKQKTICPEEENDDSN